MNGWLTKLSAPIVLYDGNATTGWRFPWDIPVEDYLYGFALLTLTMLLWDAAARKRRPVTEVAGIEPAVTSPPKEASRGTPS